MKTSKRNKNTRNVTDNRQIGWQSNLPEKKNPVQICLTACQSVWCVHLAYQNVHLRNLSLHLYNNSFTTISRNISKVNWYTSESLGIATRIKQSKKLYYSSASLLCSPYIHVQLMIFKKVYRKLREMHVMPLQNFWTQMFCLFGGFRPTREFFTHLETLKILTYARHLRPLSSEAGFFSVPLIL